MSNSSQSSDRRGGRPGTVACRVIQPVEVRPALSLILSHRGRPASEEQIVDFLRFAVQRRLNLNDIWLVERAGHVLWAIFPVVSPGRTMLLLSPAAHPNHQTLEPVICELIDAIGHHWASRGVHLAQALVDPTDVGSQETYSACGFATLAELIYLQASGRMLGSSSAPEADALVWLTYSAQTHERFARAIGSSYEGSLDCPGLNGRREMEDIIAGHKAAGEFDPNLWLLLCDAADPHRPLGVLLLAGSRSSDVLELVYLGVTPEARGRGIGTRLMARALRAVREQNCSYLSLAVDSRNTPALKLYYRHGMQRVCSKLALLRDLRVEQRSQKPVARSQ